MIMKMIFRIFIKLSVILTWYLLRIQNEISKQNPRFELPVTTTFQPFKPLLHAGSWLESTLVQNNKIDDEMKDEILFFLSASVALEHVA